MKLPEYSLKQPIKTWPNGNTGDAVEFLPGTLIMPFWNDGFVPAHIKERFKKPKNEWITYRETEKKTERMVICLIGSTWVEVPLSHIRTN